MTRICLHAGMFALLTIVAANGQTTGPLNLTVANSPDAKMQQPGNALPNPALGTLDQLIQEALNKNPAVQSAFRQLEGLKHRIPQAKTLPDPTVSVGWAGNITPFSVQTADPSSYRAVSASQMLPYPGKLKLQGKIADREAEAAYWDYESVRRRVVADVKTAYYDYAYYAKAIETTQKNKDLLEKLSKISEARYRVGKAAQQDVLKSQVETSMIEQRLTMLDQQLKTAQARINTLLFRDADAPLPLPAGMEPVKLEYSLEQLYQMALAEDTGLQREQRMVERSEYAASLARKSYYPDLTVGYMYQQRPDLPDMHGFTATANIPIFYRSKQRESVRENSEQLISAERSKDNRKTELFFSVKEQYLMAKSSERLFQLYAQGVVPQSSLALESSMSAYQVGNVDFLTILSNFNTVLDYEVNYYRELANYNMAVARLEPFVGVELTK
jgi:cobalt-zinc-cadmium efflux system outer membrane protein